MRTVRLLVVMMLLLLATASTALAHDDGELEFAAPLSGAEGVPVRITKAKGEAEFSLSEDGSQLRFKLKVEKINNVVASHIHLAPAGSNGPIVVSLYGSVAPGGGPIKGTIAEGTITAANLTGPLAGQPLSALIDAIQAGNTYVNVHTNDGVAPVDTGPGDFPTGEIRGQLRADD